MINPTERLSVKGNSRRNIAKYWEVMKFEAQKVK